MKSRMSPNETRVTEVDGPRISPFPVVDGTEQSRPPELNRDVVRPFRFVRIIVVSTVFKDTQHEVLTVMYFAVSLY